MLMQSAGTYDLGNHAKLTEDNKYLIIKEQVGPHESQTVDLYLKLSPQVAKEIDFALRVYAQELEHGDQAPIPTHQRGNDEMG